MSVDQITSPIVRDLLLDIWLEIPETARRVRQRIGAVIDWSVEAGHRETPLLLPSAGKGLPKQSRKKNHHAALPYEQLPAFMKALRTGDSISRALEFTI
jgi:nucleotidyltransferase/DNA polymerase involved in DNA repair